MVVRIGPKSTAILVAVATSLILLVAPFVPSANGATTSDLEASEKHRRMTVACANIIAECQTNFLRFPYDGIMYSISSNMLKQVYMSPSSMEHSTPWCAYGERWELVSIDWDSNLNSCVWFCYDESDTLLAIAYGNWYEDSKTIRLSRLEYLSTYLDLSAQGVEGEFDSNPS